MTSEADIKTNLGRSVTVDPRRQSNMDMDSIACSAASRIMGYSQRIIGSVNSSIDSRKIYPTDHAVGCNDISLVIFIYICYMFHIYVCCTNLKYSRDARMHFKQ